MDRRTCVLGRGDEVFDKAVLALRAWRVHRGSGIVVLADDEPRRDLVVAMSAPLPIGYIDLACRVVDTVDQQDQFGFTYGTLSVHPEQGEESFTVTRGVDFNITFDVLAVSRPRMWAARACPPISRALQHRATSKYLPRHAVGSVGDVTMNRFTELIGCRYPLQQAGMSGTATPALATAVSNAGGLGMIGIGRQPFDVIERYLDEVDELTSNPVGCSCIAHFVRPEVVELVASRMPIIEFFYEWPNAARVPENVICGWQVGSVDEAKAAVDAGCRYVIAQGTEAGGHVRGDRSAARRAAGRPRARSTFRWLPPAALPTSMRCAGQWRWEPTPCESEPASWRPGSPTLIPTTSTPCSPPAPTIRC